MKKQIQKQGGKSRRDQIFSLEEILKLSNILPRGNFIPVNYICKRVVTFTESKTVQFNLE